MNFLSSWRPVLHKTHSSPNLRFLLFGIKQCAEKAAFCITNRPQRQRQHKKTAASFTPTDSDSVLLHDGLLHQVTSGTKRGQGQNKANLSVHFGQRYKISRGQQSDLFSTPVCRAERQQGRLPVFQPHPQPLRWLHACDSTCPGNRAGRQAARSLRRGVNASNVLFSLLPEGHSAVFVFQKNLSFPSVVKSQAYSRLF